MARRPVLLCGRHPPEIMAKATDIDAKVIKSANIKPD
jgi:hypothetical protein